MAKSLDDGDELVLLRKSDLTADAFGRVVINAEAPIETLSRADVIRKAKCPYTHTATGGGRFKFHGCDKPRGHKGDHGCSQCPQSVSFSQRKAS